ncbi:ABC transporter permease [Georgenia wangjunii]|uniref:ABC transporter permease n=1 Tax=Georgenia wangjunii TaxID=3117730 RepID=UPI002F26611D
MRPLWTMVLSDLRQRVRDKSVIIFALVVPLALMYVFNLTIGASSDVELEPITVAAAAPADDALGATLVGVLGEIDGLDVTVEEVSPEEAVARVDDGGAALAVVVPDGFTRAVMAGEGPVVDVRENDDGGLEAGIVLSVMTAVLDQYAAGAEAAGAGAELGLSPEALGALAEQAATAGPAMTLVEGETASEQLSMQGSLVAGQAGLFLLFTVGFGVLGLVAEREQGTLARLRSMPMSPWLIVAAKGLVSYILGVVATAVLLTVGSQFFDVSFGSPLAVGVLVLCAVAAATSLMFIIASLTRTAEQAGILQSIIAVVLGMAGGAFFQISATGALGTLLDLNPIAAFTRGLGMTSGGAGVGEIGVPVAIMLGFAVVCLGLSRLLPDRGAEL